MTATTHLRHAEPNNKLVIHRLCWQAVSCAIYARLSPPAFCQVAFLVSGGQPMANERALRNLEADITNARDRLKAARVDAARRLDALLDRYSELTTEATA